MGFCLDPPFRLLNSLQRCGPIFTTVKLYTSSERIIKSENQSISKVNVMALAQSSSCYAGSPLGMHPIAPQTKDKFEKRT